MAESRYVVHVSDELAAALTRYRRGRIRGFPSGRLAVASKAGAPAAGEGARKQRPQAPAPPPSVATAALLVHSAAAQVLGLRPSRLGGEMQPLWVAEPGHGKITLSLEGSGRSPFPKEDAAHEALLDAVERVAAALVAADREVTVFEVPRAEAEQRYGAGACDDGAAAAGAAAANGSGSSAVRLAWVPGAALLPLPLGWALCARTGAIGSIRFAPRGPDGAGSGSGKKPDTLILAKKKTVSIRFSVEKDAPAAPQELRGAAPDAAAAAAAVDGSVRERVKGVDFDVAVAAKAAAAAEAKAPEKEEDDTMVVTIETVSGTINYEKLIEEWHAKRITAELLERIGRVTVGRGRVPALHPWFRREIFYSHRDLDALCAIVEKGQPFYLYTGRGPTSAAMHVGHLVPFMMAKWLQEAFDVPIVIQMTDDEKFLWKGVYTDEDGDDLMRFQGLTFENAKDIIACGFDKRKTFIFSDLDYVGHMYPNIVRIWKAITYSTARSAFGFVGESNIGQSAFPAIQAAPSFPSSFQVPLRGQELIPCLIPCAIDQDPYFRVTREIAHKLVPRGHPLGGKPALLHSKFFPPLHGTKGKMSSSDENSAIFLTDTPEQIETKIMKYAFSGGRDTAEEQRQKGANLEVDVPYQWLRFFLHDDAEMEKIRQEYGTGQGEYWSTGKVKRRLIVELQKIIAAHQERREKITEEEVHSWMQVRELEF